MTSSAPTADETTVYPTHTCFDDTADYLNELARAGATLDELFEYTIVHGVIVAPDGSRIAHAWLYHKGNVIEGGIYKGERVWIKYTLEEFLSVHTVEEATRYTITEAARLDREVGLAPWKEEYRALCSNKVELKTWRVGKDTPCEDR